MSDGAIPDLIPARSSMLLVIAMNTLATAAITAVGVAVSPLSVAYAVAGTVMVAVVSWAAVTPYAGHREATLSLGAASGAILAFSGCWVAVDAASQTDPNVLGLAGFPFVLAVAMAIRPLAGRVEMFLGR